MDSLDLDELLGFVDDYSKKEGAKEGFDGQNENLEDCDPPDEGCAPKG